MKSIALARNILTVELHQHTNCEILDSKTSQLQLYPRPPYDRRIMPNPDEIIVLHHFDLYSLRKDTTTYSQQIPTEYALYYYNLTIGQ